MSPAAGRGGHRNWKRSPSTVTLPIASTVKPKRTPAASCEKSQHAPCRTGSRQRSNDAPANPRTSTCSMKASAVRPANRALNGRTIACSTPKSASNSSFSRSVDKRAGAESGVKIRAGAALKVRTAGGNPDVQQRRSGAR